MIIAIGPYTGSYGHFFCHYIPFIAELRNKYPDAIIVCSADHVFKCYAKMFCDHFYGFNHNWSIVLAPGSIVEESDNFIWNYIDVITKELGKPDLIINTMRDCIALHNLYITAGNQNLNIFREQPYNSKSNLILLWQRFKRAATERNGNSEHWKQTAEHLLSQGFQVGCLGVSEAKINHPGVIDYTTLDPTQRGYTTYDLLQKARCVIMDQSGIFNEVLFIGTPGLIFNCDPGHIKKIPHRNIFKTKLTFYTPRPWPHWQINPLMDGDLSYMPEWFKQIDKFIKECETDKPHLLDVANHSGVFVRTIS